MDYKARARKDVARWTSFANQAALAVAGPYEHPLFGGSALMDDAEFEAVVEDGSELLCRAKWYKNYSDVMPGATLAMTLAFWLIRVADLCRIRYVTRKEQRNHRRAQQGPVANAAATSPDMQAAPAVDEAGLIAVQPTYNNNGNAAIGSLEELLRQKLPPTDFTNIPPEMRPGYEPQYPGLDV